jgi:hypothetical protein
MDRIREKQAIETKIVRCRELAKEFPHDPTTQMIRDSEEELRRQIENLQKTTLLRIRRYGTKKPTSCVRKLARLRS